MLKILKMIWRKRILNDPRWIFVLSLIATILVLTVAKGIIVSYRHQRMVNGANSSYRHSDFAQNLLIMDGDSGFVGASKVYVKYQQNGVIQISGVNNTDEYQWKRIAELWLNSGSYTFTGLNEGVPEEIELQLDYRNDEDTSYEWFFLSNEDICFEINETKKVEVFVRIGPNIEVCLSARPALYKEN